MMGTLSILPKYVLLVSMVLIGCFVATNAHADTRSCTLKEAYAAEEESDTFRSWSDLYRSYIKYSHCDDGAISEGYSYSVTELLTRHWNEFNSLMRLAARSNHFEAFVVSHINETMSPSDADEIIDNALDKCPKLGVELCARIGAAAQLAKSRL